MNGHFVSYYLEYDKTYVTNDVLSHILSICPFVLKELALEGGSVAERLECWTYNQDRRPGD